jgi:O-acetylserine/cysteine efflux transporter
MDHTLNTRDFLLSLIAMMLWGLNFAVSKLALAEFPPILLCGLRFAVVALLLAPFHPRPRRLGPVIALAATLGLLHYGVLFSALTMIDASTAAIVMQLQVPFGAILAALVLREKFSWRDGFGMGAAFAGVALIAGAPRLETGRVGVALFVIAALAWALSSIQIKWLGPINVFQLNGWLAVFIAIELLMLSVWREGSPLPAIRAAGWRGWTGVAYTSLAATIAAFGLWARMIARHPIGRMMPFMLTVPLFAILGGVVLNGDRITPDIVIGGALTIAGVAMMVLRRARPLAPGAAPTPA